MKKIVAVTACPTGIAHTFMTAEKIKLYCKDKGYECKVETQGSDGVQNKLTAQDIASADGIILAVDVPVVDDSRFEGQNYYKLGTQACLKNVEDSVEKALSMEKSSGPIVGDTGGKTDNTPGWLKHIMSGISHMIPVLVLAGLLLAIGDISKALLEETTLYDPLYTEFFSIFGSVGFFSMKTMYAFFAAYLAYSIAGSKNALVGGFIGGLMTDEVFRRFYFKGDIAAGGAEYAAWVPSSFFGALAIGFIIGYSVKFMQDKIKIRQEFTTIKTMLIIPLVMGIILVISMMFFINPFFGWVNQQIYDLFIWLGNFGEFIYHGAVAAGTAFDLGGPVNKAVGAVAMGFTNADVVSSLFNLTSRTLAIIIPPIGIGVAAILDRKDRFSKEERALASTSIFLGLCGISEGAIPFILKNPRLIIANMVGAMVGAWTAVALGAAQMLPLPAVWGWPLVKSTKFNFAFAGPLAYIIGLIVGVLTVAFLSLFFIDRQNKAQQKRAAKKA